MNGSEILNRLWRNIAISRTVPLPAVPAPRPPDRRVGDVHAKVEGKHACGQAALAAAAMETVNHGALAEGGL
jgi:hypothetical protein